MGNYFWYCNIRIIIVGRVNWLLIGIYVVLVSKFLVYQFGCLGLIFLVWYYYLLG